MTDASIDVDETGANPAHGPGASREFAGSVVALEPIMGDSVLLTVAAPPQIARETRAGRFFEILCRYEETFDPLLRRPYSAFAADPESGLLQFLVRPYGRGSAWLARRAFGDPLNILGPLGNTYRIASRAQNLLMVAGGVGVAPLVMLANEAVARGCNVVFLLGATTADALLAPQWLPGDVEYVVATDDGSKGRHGFITDLIPEYVRWADQVFACGPEPMYRSLRNVLMPLRVGGRPPVQVSMERAMACGLGACLGCMVETRRGLQTTCVQGPVFDMGDIVW
ncbi:MAG: dihydroorotate dehydrogenase electron transfer subunit [Thermomicrobiales bacterium]|nr:dihydroorotate dehydrogenase electron transfer subunit [Thermomicrobiales bacterium]